MVWASCASDARLRRQAGSADSVQAYAGLTKGRLYLFWVTCRHPAEKHCMREEACTGSGMTV